MPQSPNTTSNGTTNGTGRTSAPSNGAARVASSAGAAPAQRPQQTQAPQLASRPAQRPPQVRKTDVDGATWSNKRSDNDVMALMSDSEESGGAIAFGAGHQNVEDDGSSVDSLLADLGIGGGDDSDEIPSDDSVFPTDEQPVEDAEQPEIDAETVEEDQPEAEEDDFDALLRADEARSAARELINAGWDKDKIAALYKSDPDTLLEIAKRTLGGKDQPAQGQQQQNFAQTFDKALDEALNPTLAEISKHLDGEGDPLVSKAIAGHTRAAIGFLGDRVASAFKNLETQMLQRIDGLNTIVRNSEMASARSALGEQFPGLSDEKVFKKVAAKMTTLAKADGASYASMRALMEDAANLVLGKQTRAQTKVQEFKKNQQKSLGSASEGGVGQNPGPREITRDQAQEIIHALIEKGVDPAKRAEHMKKFKIAKPKPAKG